MKKNYLNLFLIVLIAGAFSLTSCSDDSDGGGGSTVPDKTVLEMMEADANFSKFVEIVVKAKMESKFSGSTKYTLILPYNQDLDNAGVNVFNMTEADAKDFVLYHLIAGEMAIADFPLNGYLSSENETGAEGKKLSIYSNAESGVVRLNGIQIETQKKGTNGSYYPYQGVLEVPNMMDQLSNNPNLKNYKTMAAIEAQSKALFNGTKKFTAFATYNDQVQAYADGIGLSISRLSPSQMRTYMHIGIIDSRAIHSSGLVSGSYTTLAGDITLAVSGSSININNKSNVILRDVIATNGILHVVDVNMKP